MLPGIGGLVGRAGFRGPLAAFDPAGTAGYVSGGADVLTDDNRKATVTGNEWARNVKNPFPGNSVIAVTLTAAPYFSTSDNVGFGVTARVDPYTYPGNNNTGDSGYGFYASGLNAWYAISPDQGSTNNVAGALVGVPLGFAYHAASRNLYLTFDGLAFFDIKSEPKTLAQVADGAGLGSTGLFLPPVRFAAGMRVGNGPSSAQIIPYPWAMPPGFVEHS